MSTCLALVPRELHPRDPRPNRYSLRLMMRLELKAHRDFRFTRRRPKPPPRARTRARGGAGLKEELGRDFDLPRSKAETAIVGLGDLTPNVAIVVIVQGVPNIVALGFCIERSRRDRGDVLVVGQVEDLRHQFQAIALGVTNILLQAHIIDNSFALEMVVEAQLW